MTMNLRRKANHSPQLVKLLRPCELQWMLGAQRGDRSWKVKALTILLELLQAVISQTTQGFFWGVARASAPSLGSKNKLRKHYLCETRGAKCPGRAETCWKGYKLWCTESDHGGELVRLRQKRQEKEPFIGDSRLSSVLLGKGIIVEMRVLYFI